ncbi:DUF6268 family outer membrane beta-barrel protein [Puia dinghuensis]|uniref:DUF6268 family outer membrane beta-barrel protein n=1 Tax=Puia dinghuensis TaxID=1792502 RepID=UPI00166C5B3A|nr:DUF6268 family outer membrane beta-barrel protein [Puia dinghuensis]
MGSVSFSDQAAPISAGGNTFVMQQPVADISIPVYKNFSSPHPLIIKTGLRYEGLLLSNEKNIGSNNFHALTLPLLLSYSITRSFNLSLIGMATVSSDFKRNFDVQDMIYTAGVRIGFRPNNSLRYGVTLTYISNYSGKFLIPVPDIEWEINKRLSLSAVIPARVSLKYKLNQTQSFGITSGYTGGMYLLNDAATKQYLHLQQFSGGLVYDLHLTRRLKLDLMAGHTFVQRLETFNMDQKVSFDGFGKLGDRVSNVSYQQNSFNFQGGLSYQF